MGRHLDFLQASTDGPIPASAWRAAVAADRAEDHAIGRRPGCKVKHDSIRLKRRGLVARMASDLVKLRAAKGFATKEDLLTLGWTQRDLGDFAAEAVPLANRRWNDRCAGANERRAA